MFLLVIHLLSVVKKHSMCSVYFFIVGRDGCSCHSIVWFLYHYLYHSLLMIIFIQRYHVWWMNLFLAFALRWCFFFFSLNLNLNYSRESFVKKKTYHHCNSLFKFKMNHKSFKLSDQRCSHHKFRTIK